jgi:hypothetical protein
MANRKVVSPQMDHASPGESGWLAHPGALAAWSMIAAFGAYASMYGFRKPFTAGNYSDSGFTPGFKVWLIVAQVLGYTVSKFVGIRVVAEMRPSGRAATLLALIGAAELSLILFGLIPTPWNLACLFLNGLPLGMVFGLVLGFLEGRRMTEALVAGLCASFIVADGFAKSVGATLLKGGVPERWMPAVAGLIFLAPLLAFVWMLQRIPAPTEKDHEARSPRSPMTRADRRRWLKRHGVGLGLITAGYLLVTVLRSLRADFAPELWAGLGVTGAPSLFTISELWVALGVVLSNGLIFLVHDNRRSFFLALGVAIFGLLLGGVALLGQSAGWLAPLPFMILMGLGMYLPYVAVHTTVFERLIAMTRDQGNIGFLMYLADAFGYLGYVGVMLGKLAFQTTGSFLEFFRPTAAITLGLAALAFLIAWRVFAVRIPRQTHGSQVGPG